MTEEKQPPAWDWPMVWSKDEKFWREVATRTVAGIFSILAIGVPSVIYGASNGVLNQAQTGTLIIGGILFLGVVLLYFAVRGTIKLVLYIVKRRAEERANRIAQVEGIKGPTSITVSFKFGPQYEIPVEWKKYINPHPTRQSEQQILSIETTGKRLRKVSRAAPIIAAWISVLLGTIGILGPFDQLAQIIAAWFGGK